MWKRLLDADTEAQLAHWMEELAAEPIQEPLSISAAAIWQKAELLRRWDAQRKAATPIDIGERVQVGIGLAGALTLVVWLSRQLPDTSFSPTVTAALVASVLLLVSAAAFSIWALFSEE